MAKSSVKDANDEISALKIYNFLQTNHITNEIFLEILSEIKDKHGYKRLKQMVMDLISTHKNALHNPATERSKRASIINEVCMIAFTIDTVFPNVLRMKVQQEFPKLINDILCELKDEKKIDNFVPYTKPQISASTADENSVKASPVPVNSSCPNSGKASSSKTPSPIINTSVKSSSKAASSKTSSPITNTTVKSPIKKNNVTVKNKLMIQRKLKDNVESMSKDVRVAEAVQSIPKDLKEAKVTETVKKPEEKTGRLNKDNDAESDIFSMLSVSSVHTSELSSFDDAISLSSEDEENQKKKIKIDDLKEMYQNDRISLWCAENFHGSKSRRSSLGTETDDHKATESNEPQTKVVTITEEEKVPIKEPTKLSTITEEERKPTKEVTKMTTPEGSPKSTSLFWTSTPQKVLPRRIRKPNSKYSDSILDPITLKQHKREIDSDLRTIAAESPLPSPQKRKRMKSASSNEDKETDLPIKNQEVDTREEKNAVNSVKNANQPSSNLYKPFTSVQPLTSRGSTAPVTLFSTCAQRLKK